MKKNKRQFLAYLPLTKLYSKNSRGDEVAGDWTLFLLIDLSSGSLLNIRWQSEVLAEHICKLFAV